MPRPDPAAYAAPVTDMAADMETPLLVEDSWFVDCVERLFADFEQTHALTVILTVAHQCRAELEGSGPPTAALPELVERLARQRLAPRAHGRSAQGST